MAQETQLRAELHTPRVWRSRLRGNSGSALVESALSIGILMALVVGIMEFGLLLYSYNFISNAAREGTRYAIVRGATWANPPWNAGACSAYTDSGCIASIGNIQDYVKSLAFPGIDTTNLTVSPITLITAGGTACDNPTLPAPGGGTDTSKPPTCNAAGDWVQVTVTYNFPFSVPGIPQKTLSISSTSSMVITQ